MQTIQLTVGPDGRVEIPDTRPGETVTIQIASSADVSETLTLATARTDEERTAVANEILRRGRELRPEGGDDELLSITHGDLLYDEESSL